MVSIELIQKYQNNISQNWCFVGILRSRNLFIPMVFSRSILFFYNNIGTRAVFLGMKVLTRCIELSGNEKKYTWRSTFILLNLYWDNEWVVSGESSTCLSWLSNITNRSSKSVRVKKPVTKFHPWRRDIVHITSSFLSMNWFVMIVPTEGDDNSTNV